MCLQYKSSEDTVGKGEIACNEQFGELPAIFIKFEIVICKVFQFRPVQNLFLWKGLIMDDQQ